MNMKSNRRARHGSLTVELALTAPIFFLVIFASMEFARVHTVKNSIENAAFEGARRGIVPGATATQCRNVAVDLVNTVGLKEATITVDPVAITPSTQAVTVTIDVPLNAENGFGISGFLKNRTLTQSVTLPIAWTSE